jgi:hypothetical protein
MDRQNHVRRAVGWKGAIVLLSVSCLSIAVRGQESQSEPFARELATLMAQRKLDAYATRDPDAPDTFIAALVFPRVQLLVVAGKPTVPAAADAQLNQRQYADVYAMLHQAVVPESKLFVQDLKADGLHAKVSDTADIVYERVVKQVIFDGSPEKHRLTVAKYAEEFARADAAYKRLLTALIAALKQSATASSP